jgi:conjugative transfer region protein TrbK
MDDKRTLKIVVIATLGAVALAAAIAFETPDPAPRQQESSVPAVSNGHDPLDAALARCRTLGPDDPVDARCRAAWTESNRRFFGEDRAGR